MNLVSLISDLFLAKKTYWICINYQTTVRTETAWAKKTNKTCVFPTEQD